MADPTAKRRKLTDLIPDLRNANKGTERGLRMLDDSLREDGAGRGILLDRNGNVIAGNKTLERAVDQGFEEVIVVPTDGKQLVATQRLDVDIDSPQGRRMALRDNRVGQVDLDWNADELKALADEGVDLAGLWNEDELALLLKDETEPTADPGAHVDKAAELQTKWQVQPGDLWQIGKHRLLCGDSTQAADVTRVMGGERADMVVTDPPYGVEYEGGTVRREALIGDLSPSLYAPFLTTIVPYCAKHCAFYLFYADGDMAVTQAVTQAGLTVRNTLIWNKQQAQFGALSAQYKQKHEPFLYCYFKNSSPHWYGPTNEVTVWDVDRAMVNAEHPTQKPVDLFVRALNNSTQKGQYVFDGFLGSGTTLVACEQTGRVGRGIEIEPKYCSVILERLSAMGLTPERA